VGFESVVGVGSSFWIELPQAPQQASPRRAQASVEHSRLMDPGPAHVIVYIEDHPANIAFMKELLADIPRIELLTATTAELGIELVRAHRPSAVILDINLPGMSGIQALRTLRSWPETRHIPAIALSAAAMAHNIDGAKDAGFYRYLTKPVRADELLDTIEELLVSRGERPLDAS